MKRKLLFSILAVVPAALLPLAAAGQVAPASSSAPAETEAPTYRWQGFIGFGYTSLNQVNQSRSGLGGVDFAVTRNWGKHFGLTANGSYYAYAFTSGNPGTPKVDMVLFGPEFHADVYGKFGGFLHGLLGGQHTAGESITPNIAFAGGFGGGMDYALNPRLSVRAYGDDIGASTVQDPDHLGYSPHTHFGARAGIGVVYKF